MHRLIACAAMGAVLTLIGGIEHVVLAQTPSALQNAALSAKAKAVEGVEAKKGLITLDATKDEKKLGDLLAYRVELLARLGEVSDQVERSERNQPAPAPKPPAPAPGKPPGIAPTDRVPLPVIGKCEESPSYILVQCEPERKRWRLFGRRTSYYEAIPCLEDSCPQQKKVSGSPQTVRGALLTHIAALQERIPRVTLSKDSTQQDLETFLQLVEESLGAAATAERIAESDRR